MNETDLGAHTERVPVWVSDELVYVEVTPLGGEEEVAGRTLDFGVVTRSVGAVAAEVSKAVQLARPDKVTIELGCDIGLESGQLTAILVKGAARANLKLVLSWERPPAATQNPAQPGQPAVGQHEVETNA